MTIEGQADFTKDFLNRVAAAMSGQTRRSLTMMEMCCRHLMLLRILKNKIITYVILLHDLICYVAFSVGCIAM
jgi:hypothetical protein